jgi:DNA-binding SARP family transcriptional activator
MFRLKVLGGISLERDGRPVGGRASQRRRLALLAYLAAAGDRAVSRDKLIALLWPERDQERGRHSLSQMLWALRQELGDEAVLAGIDELRLNPEVVHADLRELEQALARKEWERAVESYTGAFLDGFFISEAPEFERWATERREAVAGAVAASLETLACAAAARGDHPAAASWWKRRTALDPLDSRLTLRLMESLAAAGDRGGAIRHARVHAELLRGQLDAPPDPSVEALAASLKRSSNGSPPVAPVALPAARAPELAVPEAALPEGEAPARRRGRAPLYLGFALAAGLALFVLVHSRSVATASQPRSAVLGSFAGADSTLALAVREAFRAELVRDESVRLLPEFEVAEGLRLMQLPATTPLRGTVAEELGTRLGAYYVISGTVAPLGAGLQLVIQVVSPASHAAVLTLSGRPERREEVIAEVGRLTRELRQRLGRLPLPDSARPLPAVTTSSLEALEQYALARQALGRGDRMTAITLGEGALAHDSLFPLAHYLVGDLLWWNDQQSHSEAHLRRAQQLVDIAPVREQFLVRARYQHLVADRPDSALTYYLQLRAAYPDEVLAYEGMAWSLRALGRHREAAAVADTALRLGAAALVPTLNNQVYSLISVGDTVAALEAIRPYAATAVRTSSETRYLVALLRHDWNGALAVLDREFGDSGVATMTVLSRRHAPLLALGRLAEGRAALEEILRLAPERQYVPRGLLLQAIAEHEAGNDGAAGRLARRAKQWVDSADLSAAALARLYERLAELGSWLGDAELVQAVRAAILRRDGGRNLRSFVLVLETVDGAAALLRGHAGEAAGRLAAARRETFHGRSTSSLGILEADALAGSGELTRAAALYRAVDSFRIADPDFEIWPLLSRVAARRLARLGGLAAAR